MHAYMFCELCSVQSLCSKTYSTYILSYLDHLDRRTEKKMNEEDLIHKKSSISLTNSFMNKSATDIFLSNSHFS